MDLNQFVVAQWKGDPRDASARFDALADAFHRETGMMAPGKDVAAAMGGGGPTYEERWDAWRAWLAKRRET